MQRVFVNWFCTLQLYWIHFLVVNSFLVAFGEFRAFVLSGSLKLGMCQDPSVCQSRGRQWAPRRRLVRSWTLEKQPESTQSNHFWRETERWAFLLGPGIAPRGRPFKLLLCYRSVGASKHKPHQLIESESEVAQSCPTPCDHMDCNLPGSSIHGIFQARVLEWGAITFSTNNLYWASVS